jgi:hypothetical protein
MTRPVRHKLRWTRKKIAGSLRARRRSERCLAGAPGRSGPQTLGVRGRIFDEHRPHAPLRQGPQKKMAFNNSRVSWAWEGPPGLAFGTRGSRIRHSSLERTVA